MATVVAQKIPTNNKELNANDIYYTFCYYYPQYKLHEAKKMPYNRVLGMISTAKKIKASEGMMILQCIASSRDKKSYKNLLNSLERIVNS